MIITLAYLYGPRNAGDMALNIGALDIINKLNNLNINAISRFSEKHECFGETVKYLGDLYDNVKIVPFPVNYDRNEKKPLKNFLEVAKGSFMYVPRIEKPITGKNEIIQAIEKSDYLIFNGGNLLFSRNIKDNLRLKGILYPVYIAEKINKPYIFLPQSIPSLENSSGKKKILRIINDSKLSLFRESNSVRKIYKNGLNNENVFPDLAFFIDKINRTKSNEILKNKNLNNVKYVPIILRATSLGDQGQLSEKEQANTIKLISNTIKKIISSGMNPLFIIQTKSDIEFTKKCKLAIEDYLDLNVPLLEEYDPLVLRGIYEKAQAVITFRLHAAIFSLSVGTKTIGIYRKIWGPKMPGIFKDFGIEGWCFNIESGRVYSHLAERIFEVILSNNSALSDVKEMINNERSRLVSVLANAISS